MQRDLADFAIYLSSEKGLSSNTLEAYGRDVEFFLRFLKGKNIQGWLQVTQQHITDFIAQKKERGYASSSLKRHLIAIKMLFKFLKREGIIVTNITLLLENPKLWQLIPEVMTEIEVERLLNQPDQATLLGLRDKAILEVLYASGLRVSELCQLKIYDVDDTFVKVKGKGGKERMVPIGTKAIEALDAYLSHPERDVQGREEALFLKKGNNPMDRITIWNRIKYYAKKAGIQRNISPHTFRHSFATHLLNHGADLRILQDMLGHSNINSTDRYTHISYQHIQDAFNTFHPRMD